MSSSGLELVGPTSPLGAFQGRRTIRQHRRRIDAHLSPVDAYRRAGDPGAALLESRGEHPAARFTFLAVDPVYELRLGPEGLREREGSGPWRLAGEPPLQRLASLLQGFGSGGPDSAGFDGGWVGYLSHEAASWILATPVPRARPPARPALSWGHFRLYRDAVAFDRADGSITLVANELGDKGPPAAERLRRLEARLARPAPAPAVAPARARPEPTASLDDAGFRDRVDTVQSLVRTGDCFQVNLTASYAYPWEAPPGPHALLALYDAYAAANPGAWGGYYPGPDCTLLSSSPECLADWREATLRLRPIAGTRPRGSTVAEDERLADELRGDPKERAEHAMLVDLARNDAAALCEPGSVRVPNLGGVERYRHVMHLVSEVEGRPRADLTLLELLRAVFPGGTVTGAPKRRAVQRIAELEGGPRGPYTGTLGYVGLNGATQWNLLIRTLVATPTHLVAHAGCGIVEGSRASREAAELEAKARAQVEAALGRATPAPPELRCGRVEPGPPWSPGEAGPPLAGRRVLLVDCEDSFVHNLADYCRRLGATARVHSVHDAVAPAWDPAPTHVVLSPGPGRPEDFPRLEHHLARAEGARVPVLGVCLGHQAIAHVAGARIVRHPETVHGRASHLAPAPAAGEDPLLASWRGRIVGRYHSLIARDLPPRLETLATLSDGTCMALRHRERPWWGLQFHPESLLTERGLDLVRAFLEVPGHD